MSNIPPIKDNKASKYRKELMAAKKLAEEQKLDSPVKTPKPRKSGTFPGPSGKTDAGSSDPKGASGQSSVTPALETVPKDESEQSDATEKASLPGEVAAEGGDLGSEAGEESLREPFDDVESGVPLPLSPPRSEIPRVNVETGTFRPPRPVDPNAQSPVPDEPEQSRELRRLCADFVDFKRTHLNEQKGMENDMRRLFPRMDLMLKQVENLSKRIGRIPTAPPEDDTQLRVENDRLNYLITTSAGVFKQIDLFLVTIKEKIESFTTVTTTCNHGIDERLQKIISTLCERSVEHERGTATRSTATTTAPTVTTTTTLASLVADPKEAVAQPAVGLSVPEVVISEHEEKVSEHEKEPVEEVKDPKGDAGVMNG